MKAVNPLLAAARRRGLLRVLAMLLGAISAACASAAAVVTSTESAAPYPRSPGPAHAIGADTLTLLPRGATAFPVIRALIDSARASVHVEMYEFGRLDLAASLVAAAHRGVAVTLIDDPSVDITRATASELRAEGVDVVEYPVRSGMIDHVKLLVIDGRVAVVGGINWGASSDRNHDVDAEVTGPAAANLEAVFLRDLTTCGRPVTTPRVMPDDAVLVATTLPNADIRPLALRLVDGAQHTLDLELYVLTDTGIVHAVERAHRRGVRVRVLLDPSERPNDAAAAALQDAGVDVRIYRSHGEKLHAKVGVADGRTVLFGSANWTSSGFERNHELDVALPDAPAIAAELIAMADADWAASAP